ncbi:MAG TPA: MFS transporter [Gammaproteobacteria bacterium]|nr:MFS transporter [Gammaproteobacteria bacterium]
MSKQHNISPLGQEVVNFKTRFYPWIVCLSVALFFFYQFLDMSSFNTLGTEIMHSFRLSTTQLGQLSAFYMYGLAIFFIPAGILLDHFSVRKLLLGAIIVATAGILLFSQAQILWVAIIGRFLSGTMHSLAFLGCCRVAARWLPNRMALALGCMVTVGLLGGIVAQAPLVLLVDYMNWRSIFLILGALGILIWVVMLIFLKDPPKDIKATWVNSDIFTILNNVKQVMKLTQNWIPAFYTCLLNLPIMILGALWGIVYLTQEHHLTSLQAAEITSMIYVGTIIGSPIFGFWSDKIQRRKLPMLIAAIFSLALILIVFFNRQLSETALSMLFFLIGFFTSAQSLTYPLIVENNPPILSSTALGFASIIIMGVGGLFQPLFGWLLKNTTSQLGSYFTSNQLAFSLLPLAFVCCIFLACLIREQRAKS